ncbi:hypothetical protein HBI73_014830 [Parastagonospora nodorum]|nr:hypothetical protein HBI10_024110 [Parastagonospora nodorum]KAH5167436.1 hypothetical protein HBI73_014830 [Parastagonospora nodorum]KAH5387934.1 hypothetical protein HBI33_052940 [Parastagonospora nodorum]KAH6232124.1 hypothetical protein HBI53_025670 [Parastagonospora nodorum]KAH6547822.1 hypothetical protein HBI07_065130 [Parastagonospora nodorum]
MQESQFRSLTLGIYSPEPAMYSFRSSHGVGVFTCSIGELSCSSGRRHAVHDRECIESDGAYVMPTFVRSLFGKVRAKANTKLTSVLRSID